MNADDKYDQAISRRLSRLSRMPVDTGSLERAVRAQVGSPRPVWSKVLRPVIAIAASIIFMAIVGIALLQDRSVQASADLMAQMHRDLVAGKGQIMKATSIDEVNKDFAAFAAGMPEMNSSAEARPMGCCMRDVGDQKIACVLFDNNGVPVTLAMADGKAVKPFISDPVTHNGQTFHVQTIGELNMVMLDHGQYRICLIGQLPREDLMTISNRLKF
jgi:hypothetical protein